MKTAAAILVELNRPLELAELDIPALKPGQALVEIAYSGVCHTQLLEARGHRGEDKFLPHCLGHEGSGTVVDTGPGTAKVKPGDRVILSWIQGSGTNVPGTVYEWGGRKVNAGGITTFQHHAVVAENRLTALPAAIGFRDAALLGCALPTGLGAVFNTLAARPGQSIAVFGTGGIGLCAVIGARIAGCWPIVAIDLVPAKLEVAKRLGASHLVNAGDGDPVAALKAICPQGMDLAVEASGRPKVMQQAVEALRMRGGRTVIVGNAHHGEEVHLAPWQFNLGKQVFGTWGGDCEPDRDFPRFCNLLAAGMIPLGPLTGQTYALADANRALDDLEGGRATRPLIDMAAGG